MTGIADTLLERIDRREARAGVVELGSPTPNVLSAEAGTRQPGEGSRETAAGARMAVV